jgi:hypothetical protein
VSYTTSEARLRLLDTASLTVEPPQDLSVAINVDHAPKRQTGCGTSQHKNSTLPTKQRRCEPPIGHNNNHEPYAGRQQHFTTTQPTTTSTLMTTKATGVVSTPKRIGRQWRTRAKHATGTTRTVENCRQHNNNQRSRTTSNHQSDIGNSHRWQCGDIGDESERTAATTLDSTEDWALRFTNPCKTRRYTHQSLLSTSARDNKRQTRGHLRSPPAQAQRR